MNRATPLIKSGVMSLVSMVQLRVRVPGGGQVVSVALHPQKKAGEVLDLLSSAHNIDLSSPGAPRHLLVSPSGARPKGAILERSSGLQGLPLLDPKVGARPFPSLPLAIFNRN
jgi:hypothetical protein